MPPSGGSIPAGTDVLHPQLSKQVSWLEKADFECKLVVAGNHDLTLDTDFFEEYGRYFHNKTPQDPAKCQELLTGSESLVYLQHASRQVKLTSPTGPRTTFSVFGSPYTPSYGKWAFQYEGNDAAADAIWADIPLDTDVVVTHGPAYLHRDESQRGAQGCEGLRRALWRVRPKIAACGHIHDARGVERVRWDLWNKHVKYKELSVQPWEDPGIGNEKNSLVDLTAKGGNPLDNNTDTDITDTGTDTASSLGPSSVPAGQAGQVTSSSRSSSSALPSWPPLQSASSSGEASSAGAGAQPGIGTRGLSGNPRSARSDQPALGAGRLGRRETCFVNCAVQTVSHAQQRGGPRVLNKPIVVDVDLPVWDC